MVFNATFNNISVISRWSVLLVEETGLPGENHRPVSSHWQTLSQYVVFEYTSPWTGFELTTLVVIDTDCTGSCKSNFNLLLWNNWVEVESKLGRSLWNGAWFSIKFDFHTDCQFGDLTWLPGWKMCSDPKKFSKILLLEITPPIEL